MEPKVPDWKTQKHLADIKESLRFKESKVADEFPTAAGRLGYLRNRDAQLTAMLNFFESQGLPLGSDRWADSIVAWVLLLNRRSNILADLARNIHSGHDVDSRRLEEDIQHAAAMYGKQRPKALPICDCCGWPEASLQQFEQGYLVCEDCLKP